MAHHWSLRHRWLQAICRADGPSAVVVRTTRSGRIQVATQCHQRAVAAVLWSHMDADGGSCYPTTHTIASEAGISESTARLSIKGLARNGWLAVGRHKIRNERGDMVLWRAPKTGHKRHHYRARFPVPGEEAVPDTAPATESKLVCGAHPVSDTETNAVSDTDKQDQLLTDSFSGKISGVGDYSDTWLEDYERSEWSTQNPINS